MTTRTEHLSGVVRAGHPLAAGPVTPERRCEFDHLAVSRRGRARGPIDVELRRRGLEPRVIAIVPEFYPALAVVAATDPVAFASTAIVDTGWISGAVAVPPPSRHRPPGHRSRSPRPGTPATPTTDTNGSETPSGRVCAPALIDATVGLSPRQRSRDPISADRPRAR